VASRQLSGLALAQLAAWRAYAARWYFRLEPRRTDKGHRIPEVEQYHLVCAVCENSITVMSSEGIGYLLYADQILDEVTRHLRNIHRDLESTVYGNEQRENGQAGFDPRGYRNYHSPNPYSS
jgi:hypothetical protein